MGTEWWVTCEKCRVNHYCGYCSYRSRDRYTAAAVAKHAEHDPVVWNTDFSWFEGDDLVCEAGMRNPAVSVRGAALFEVIDDESDR